MPTQTNPRLRLLYTAVLLLLLSACGAAPAGPAAPTATALPATLPPPAGIWLPTRTPPPPTPTLPPQPTLTRTPRPPTRTPAPPTVLAVFTPPAAGQVLIGTWGRGEISLTSDSSGGALFFTCALGRFPPLRVDGQGRFDVSGTYLDKPGFPQPTPPAPIPARYQGQVMGSTMVLTLTLFYTPPDTYTYQLPFDPTYEPPSPCA
jgi:hypothetical protein